MDSSYSSTPELSNDTITAPVGIARELTDRSGHLQLQF